MVEKAQPKSVKVPPDTKVYSLWGRRYIVHKGRTFRIMEDGSFEHKYVHPNDITEFKENVIGTYGVLYD